MPLIIACPSCAGKLRVADALYGQKVRCPTCNHTFDGPGEAPPPQAAPPAPQDLPLDLTLDEPSSPAHYTPPSGLVGAVEVESSRDDPSGSAEPETPADERRRPRLTDDRHDFDVPNLRRLGPRRDAEPHRGAVVLVLGIISVAIITFWCASPLGIILGLVAWIMGQTDLRKMKSGQMDDTGCGTTQAGWICGIIGTLLNGLVTLGCGLFIGGIWYSEMSRPPLTKPVPITRPRLPPPKKAINPVPKNPPGRKF